MARFPRNTEKFWFYRIPTRETMGNNCTEFPPEKRWEIIVLGECTVCSTHPTLIRRHPTHLKPKSEPERNKMY